MSMKDMKVLWMLNDDSVFVLFRQLNLTRPQFNPTIVAKWDENCSPPYFLLCFFLYLFILLSRSFFIPFFLYLSLYFFISFLPITLISPDFIVFIISQPSLR
jgi:hypothetical protein